MKKVLAALLCLLLLFSTVCAEEESLFSVRKVESILDGVVDGLYADDLLALRELLGKLPEEAGIPEECVRYLYKGASYYEIEVDGLLFGKHAYGTAYSEIEEEDAQRTLRDINLYSYDLNYPECYEALEKLCGGPVSSEDEPYVASNGGAVHRDTFDAGNAYVSLQMASNNDWILIEMRVKN